jgi:glycosyltransferase involved in cell wall biosynthesis
LIKKNRFNIAISFLEGPNIYLILASFGLGINSIVSERSSYFEAKNQWVYILKKQLYRLANFVVSNSETQSDWLVKTAKLPSKKVVTINNGFEVEQYFPTLKIPKFPQEIALIAIGRVTPVKNLLVVIEGLNHFYSNYHWIPTITWVGRCESGAYQSQIKKVLSQFPIVELHWKWAQEQDDIPKLIQAYHALILPSLYEGFPNVVCEALLCGRPVLVSDVCDNPRIVQEGVMGFKFNPNSPEALSDALHKLTVLSPDEWKEMSQSARAYAEKSLSINLLINKFSTLF